MASNVKGITVEIGGDTTKLGKALENSEKQSKDLQKELKQVNTALKFSPDSIELVTQKQKILTEQIEATKEKLETPKAAEAQVEAQFKAGEIGEEQFRAFQREIIETESKLKTYQSQLEETGKQASSLDELTDTITEQEKAVEQLKDEYKEAVLTYGKNSEEAKALGDELKDLSGELKDNKERMAEADKAADDLDQSLEDVGEGTEKASEGFTVLKGTIANLAANAISKIAEGLKDAATNALEVGMSFESSMSNNAALFKATDEDLQKLTETAQHYGETTQFSASEAADALGYMALAGWDVNKATSELGGVLDLAAASGMGLAEASDMVTDYLSAFSNTTMTAAEFADKLAYAQANSNTTAVQLGEAYKNSAANLNAAGQDVETVTSLLAAMANQGLKGSEAGTALSAMMRDLTKNMKDGKIQIGDTAVAVQDAEGNYLDLTDILKDVEAATAGMGDAEKAAALSSTFTSDSIKGLNLILNDGVDKAAEFEEGLRGADGAAGEMAATMNDNVAGSLKLLRSNIESKMIKVFEAAKGSIKESVGSISDSLDAINWDAVADGVGKVAKAVSDLFKFIVDNGDAILAVLKAIATAFVVYKAVSIITGVIEAFQALRTAIIASESVMAAFNTTMKLNPIGLVASAIAALVVLLVSLNDKTKESAEATYGLTEAQKELNEKIAEEAQAVRDATDARQEAMGAVESETAYNKQLWDELQSIVDANGKIKDGYQERAAVITGLLSDALGIEISIVDGQIQKYDELKKSVEEVIETKRAEALLEAGKADYTKAIQNQAKAYEDYQNKLRDFAAAQEEIREAEAKVETARAKAATGRGALVKQYNDAKAELDAVNEKYKEQKKALSDSEQTYLQYANTIQQYEGALAAMASGDVGALNEALGKLTNNFLTADNATKTMLENQLTTFRNQYQSMKEAVEAGMPGVTQEQVDQMALLVSAAETELDKLAPKAKESTKKAGEAAAEGTTSTVEDNRKAAKIVAAKVKEALESTDTKASGKKKGDDYGAGIKETGDANNQAGKQVAEKAKAGLDSSDTKATGKKKGDEYTGGISSVTEGAKKAGEKVAQNAKAGAESVKMNNSGKKAGDEYSSGIGTKSTSARNAAKGVANSGLSGFSQVSAYQTGQSFSSGFAGGIGSLSKTVENTARNIAANAVAAMQRALNSHSPSKVTEKIGEDFDSGFILGIDNLTDKAIKTARAMASGASQALTGVGDINIGEPSFSGLNFGRQLDNTFGQKTGPDFSEILAKLDAVTNAIVNNSGNAIVLDTGALVGATVNQYDNALASVYGMKARGI